MKIAAEIVNAARNLDGVPSTLTGASDDVLRNSYTRLSNAEWHVFSSTNTPYAWSPNTTSIYHGVRDGLQKSLFPTAARHIEDAERPLRMAKLIVGSEISERGIGQGMFIEAHASQQSLARAETYLAEGRASVQQALDALPALIR